jgi:DNA-binding transcriptional LysR family regulator
MDSSDLQRTRLTIDHLRSFLAVAEELNFRRAAERLYMASSPLSRRIRDVEAAVGSTLFDRGTRHVRLTAAGRRLVPLAQDVVARFDALTWTIREDSGDLSSPIRVGMPYGVHAPDRSAFLEAVRRAAAGYELTNAPGMTRRLVRQLVSGQLHASIVHGTQDLCGVAAVLIREEPFGVMLPAGHPLGDLDVIPLGAFAGMRCVTVDYHPITPMQVRMMQLLEAAGVDGEPVLTEDPEGMTSVVASSSRHFALVAASAGSPYLSFFADPDIIFRDVEGFDLTFKTYAAWLPERAENDPVVAAVARELERTFTASKTAASLTEAADSRLLVR